MATYGWRNKKRMRNTDEEIFRFCSLSTGKVGIMELQVDTHDLLIVRLFYGIYTNNITQKLKH
jgi:hypothetical protein